MIRQVNPKTDASAIAEIYNRYIEKTTVSFETAPLTVNQMQQRIENIASQYPYFVCEDNGRIIGYAYAHQWKERAAYSKTLETTIYLTESKKHEGIGTNLMQHVIGECRKRGFSNLIACVTGENTASISFHKTLGFKEVSHFINVGEKFGRLLDVIDLELQL